MNTNHWVLILTIDWLGTSINKRNCSDGDAAVQCAHKEELDLKLHCYVPEGEKRRTLTAELWDERLVR
jgi:hypothetical protein